MLGVSGGIAAYKAVEVCRRLVDAGAHVAPVLTESALRFVGRTTFDALASELASYGIDVVAIDGAPFEHYLADAYTAAIAEVAKQKGADIVVAAATAVGKDLLPRVAARLGAGMASDVTEIVDAKTFKRPMYAGNAIATVQAEGTPRVVSVRITAFDAAAKSQEAMPARKASA